MKCKDCKWYIPDEPAVVSSKTGRKEYRRCALRYNSLGWMGRCIGSHKYCFEQKGNDNDNDRNK